MGKFRKIKSSFVALVPTVAVSLLASPLALAQALPLSSRMEIDRTALDIVPRRFIPRPGAVEAVPNDTAGQIVTGTFRRTLPNIQRPAASPVNYPAPGELAFTANSTCGDYDVDHFAAEYPAIDYLKNIRTNPNQYLQVVVGYWVAPGTGGASTQVPDYDVAETNTWMPIGYTPVKIVNDTEVPPPQKNLYPVNKVPAVAATGRTLLTNELRDLLVQSRATAYKLENQATTYRLYVAPMACLTLPDVGGTQAVTGLATGDTALTANQPSATEITSAFTDFWPSAVMGSIPISLQIKIHEIPYAAEVPEDTTTAAIEFKPEQPYVPAVYEANAKYGIAYTDRVRITAGAGSYDASSDSLYVLGMELVNRNFANVATIKNMASQMKTATSCAGVTNAGNQNHWYLSYPMQLNCRALHGLRDISATRLDDLTFVDNVAMGVIADPQRYNDAEALRKDVAKILISAGVVKHVQTSLASKFHRPTVRCLPTKVAGWKMIHKIIGSLPIQFTPVTSTDFTIKPLPAATHHHPEQFYAIQDYTRYDSSNAKTIFGMSLPGETDITDADRWAIKFKPGEAASGAEVPVFDASTFAKVPLQYNFRIRTAVECLDREADSPICQVTDRELDRLFNKGGF